MNINYNDIVKDIYENVTFEMFIKFVIIYFFIIWIALIVWVIKDISNRTESILLQILSILIISLLTPFGLFIYLIIRPGKTLFEKYYNEVDENLDIMSQIVEEKTRNEEESNCCIKCKYPISHEFKFCPNCKTKLKEECSSCNKTIFAGWDICPYCGEKNDKKVEEKIIQNKKSIANIIGKDTKKD